MFNKNRKKEVARLSLAQWCNKVEYIGTKSFNVVGKTLSENSAQILYFYINRATNAFAESFNVKIRSFKACVIGNFEPSKNGKVKATF
ncbi:MAG: transposase [Bacteroidales bacterium]